MFEKDIVCRAALYPKFVKDGVFDAEALIVFGALPDQVTWALSVASFGRAAAFDLACRIRFSEPCYWHHTAILDFQPSLPVFARGVADVRRAAVGLHFQELVKVDVFALRAKFIGALCGSVELSLLDEGMPQRTMASSRRSSLLRMIGAKRSG